jgi:redox-sensitive bicupin YhaK (pirin superfamily)
MITLRRAEDRGHADHGWLNTYHTFSFANYYDPKHMGFRALRVLNDDRVTPGMGFGSHGHRDMEIISYILEGYLAHKDSMGQQHTCGANEIQAMSAGTGVIHSEFNGSKTEGVHFLQIWIVPAVEDVKPQYWQFKVEPEQKHGKLHLIAGPKGSSTGPIAEIHQDVKVYASILDAGNKIEQPIPAGRYAWVHCATGNIIVNGHKLKEGDGVAVSDEKSLTFEGDAKGGEFLYFDLN